MIIRNKFIMAFCVLLLAMSCQSEASIQDQTFFKEMEAKQNETEKGLDTIVVGGGCFWCVEAQFLLLDGVLSVRSGYAGGKVKNPTYKEVCTGMTGHAEVIEVVYNKERISTDEILSAFWQSHDVTQLNRQGNDVGTQYRSVIFYNDDAQKKLAEDYKQKLNQEKVYDRDVVTEISPLTEFYVAENYHQNYYNQNTNQGYCQYVIAPKVEKFKKVFKSKLK
ncbi:MAG TPA: peptide-methionine (S)-S-oxide reductase [Chitinophagaceae bacterium]|nr:peptide-methionine (S)-S-oxide reductase [Chitinophagaceae bacterium]